MEFAIDRREVLRYLGCGTTEPDEATAALVEECVSQVRLLATPRYLWREFPIRMGEGVELAGTSFSLEGEDIRRHLTGCKSCVLLAATIGSGIEQALRRAQVTDMARAVVLDACATAAIEGVCDQVQEEIAKDAQARGKGITWRFSPGYGDMPITQQQGFTALLDTHRKIGLAATGDNILTPRKSVTAVIGITDLPGQKKKKSCADCPLRHCCAFHRPLPGRDDAS